MITLETFNKNQLEELIHSNRFEEFPFLPITHHRAVSHINNPNLDEDSTVLILAFHEKELAGYIGILADKILFENDFLKIGWLSTIFVDPKFRGSRIAINLLQKACDAYDGNILLTEFTDAAERLYIKSKLFDYLEPLEGQSYHIQSNLQTILPSKNTKWNSISGILKLVDHTINSITKGFYNISKKKDISYEVVKHIDLETKVFINQYLNQNSFKKDLSTIDWIINFPWILRGQKSNEENYLFSDYEERFEFIFVKVYHNNILSHILFLSVRNSNAKLFFSIGNEKDEKIARVLYDVAINNSISNLISFEKGINDALNKKQILYRKARTRKFLVHKNLRKKLGKDYRFNISALDGDPVFT